MSKKSAEIYIAQNDFEGAKERLEEANPRWKSHWFNTCEQIYNSCKEWAKMYVLDPIAKTVQKVISAQSNLFPRLRKNDISYSDKSIVQTNEDRRQKCYLIEFFDKNDESVCSKVGTTIRTIQERIREELNSKTYKNMGVVRCMIHRVYDCGNIPAEGLESEFRAKYIKKYPNSFYKNDRFINEKFDLAEADKIYAEYMAQKKIPNFGDFFCLFCLLIFGTLAHNCRERYFLSIGSFNNFSIKSLCNLPS